MSRRISQISNQITMASRPNIHLYTTQTPNGIKISITLEELGLPYEFTKIDITKNTQVSTVTEPHPHVLDSRPASQHQSLKASPNPKTFPPNPH